MWAWATLAVKVAYAPLRQIAESFDLCAYEQLRYTDAKETQSAAAYPGVSGIFCRKFSLRLAE